MFQRLLSVQLQDQETLVFWKPSLFPLGWHRLQIHSGFNLAWVILYTPGSAKSGSKTPELKLFPGKQPSPLTRPPSGHAVAAERLSLHSRRRGRGADCPEWAEQKARRPKGGQERGAGLLGGECACAGCGGRSRAAFATAGVRPRGDAFALPF